jgi:hypothetical protein
MIQRRYALLLPCFLGLSPFLAGCGSLARPARPLSKGELVHQPSLQLVSNSALNYGLSYGLTDHLEVGGQAGLWDVGVRSRLHLPLGAASAVSLEGSALLSMIGWVDAGWIGDPWRYYRYEARAQYHAYPDWRRFAIGPVFAWESAERGGLFSGAEGRIPKLGGSLTLGLDVFDIEIDALAPLRDPPRERDMMVNTTLPGDLTTWEIDMKLSLPLSRFRGAPMPRHPMSARPDRPGWPADTDAPPRAPDLAPDAIEARDLLGAGLTGETPEAFAAWAARNDSNLALARRAWEGKSRREKRAASAGGKSAFLSAGGILLLGLGAAKSVRVTCGNADGDACEYSEDDFGIAMMGLGGIGLAAGTAMAIYSVVEMISLSPEERRLKEAFPTR